MGGRALTWTLAALLAACAGEPAAPDAGPVDLATIEGALAACSAGDPDGGLAVLDSALARSPGDVDGLATRGLCRWTRFAADSSAADARAAYDDFTAALAAAADRPGAARATPVDRLYSHRAFVALALDPDDWPAVIADLTAALEHAPDAPLHLLDRAVAYRSAGDTTAARADLRRFLAVADSSETARRALAREMLEALGPPPPPAAAAGGP